MPSKGEDRDGQVPVYLTAPEVVYLAALFNAPEEDLNALLHDNGNEYYLKEYGIPVIRRAVENVSTYWLWHKFDTMAEESVEIIDHPEEVMVTSPAYVEVRFK